MTAPAGGYAGRILEVDLSRGTVGIRPLETSLARDYLGGRGFTARLLWDGVPPGVDPYAPENLLVFAAGPLNGTPTPSSGRLVVAAKSPMTGALGDCNSGGYWAPELKYAGFDAVVIRGCSERPVYVMIENGEAWIRPAEKMWGRCVRETNRAIQEQTGKEDLHICTIGPAGENRVRYACVVTDGEGVGGRCGMGAVMGAKGLKAVVVRGRQDVGIADPGRFKRAVDAYLESLQGEVWTQTLRELGTPNLTEHRQRLGIWGARNFRRALLEPYDAVSGETFKQRFLVKPLGCMGCQVCCRRLSRVRLDSGQMTCTKGPEYETINALAAKPYVTDPHIVLRAQYLCDQYGMDVHGAGSAVAMAMELFEAGKLSERETEGQRLNFGNGEALIFFIHQIAHRRGFGNVLAEGVRVMGRDLGAEEAAIHVKGLEVTAADPRRNVTRALAYAVSTRGACHLRANPYIEEFITPQEAQTFFGTPAVSGMDSLEGKGRMIAWSENWVTLADQLGLCKFAWYRSRRFSMLIKRGLELAGEFLAATTGMELTGGELMECGERTYTLEKLFNLREGIGKEADYPPRRFFEEAVSEGPAKGSRLHPETYERLLRDYYTARGWDPETGEPTLAKRRSLRLP